MPFVSPEIFIKRRKMFHCLCVDTLPYRYILKECMEMFANYVLPYVTFLMQCAKNLKLISFYLMAQQQ